jgi:hypothetical protein
MAGFGAMPAASFCWCDDVGMPPARFPVGDSEYSAELISVIADISDG